jgi:hypothetical protein
MTRSPLGLCALAFFLALHPVPAHDVVIYNATPGGIGAAIAAAREGASVVIVEPSNHVGGMVTGGLSATDFGPKQETIGGLAREFYARADATYADPKKTADKRHFWYSEPHVAERIFGEMLREAKVEVVLGESVTGVEKKGARIVTLTTTSGRSFTGKIFVDASYEGDLMARAGVSYKVGRESRADFDESLAGFQTPELRPRTAEYFSTPGRVYTHGTPAKISAYGPGGKLLPGISDAPWPPAGTGDHRSQSYNYRVILTNRAENRLPIPQPTTYDPLRYEILRRIVAAFPGIRYEKLVFLGLIPNDKADANASGLVQGTDHVGANADYPEADEAARERIRQDHRDYVQGFLWFLANDERLPAELRAQAAEWGLPKDEFADNGHWPYALYVREARRMLGEYVMRQQDCASEITKPDTVGMGSFILDSHAIQRVVDAEGNVLDEGNFDVGVKPYQIPYRCLTPRKAECENLLVPVCLSATHVAYGSIRMEPQFLLLGQASGLAAVAALRANGAVQDVDVTALQTKLRAQNAVLTPDDFAKMKRTTKLDLPGITLDDSGAEYVGNWVESDWGKPLGGSAHHDGNAEKGAKTARFTLTVPAAGEYEVRFAYPAGPNRAANVPVTIVDALGATVVRVDQKIAGNLPDGFLSLGKFRFNPEQPAVVTVSNEATEGFVAADAVQLLPIAR